MDGGREGLMGAINLLVKRRGKERTFSIPKYTDVSFLGTFFSSHLNFFIATNYLSFPAAASCCVRSGLNVIRQRQRAWKGGRDGKQVGIFSATPN